MSDSQELDLKAVCKEIIDAFEGMVVWKFDGRFKTLLTEFSAEKQATVQDVLNRYFSITWDSTNIDHAPEIVKVIDRHLGGLRPGQLFFNTDPDLDAFIFCAWWPWGDNQTVSIRVAPFDKELSGDEQAALVAEIKRMAGIEDES